jgi:hypothetical protein
MASKDGAKSLFSISQVESPRGMTRRRGGADDRVRDIAAPNKGHNIADRKYLSTRAANSIAIAPAILLRIEGRAASGNS